MRLADLFGWVQDADGHTSLLLSCVFASVSLCLSVCRSVGLFVCLCLPVHVCLRVCLSVSLSESVCRSTADPTKEVPPEEQIKSFKYGKEAVRVVCTHVFQPFPASIHYALPVAQFPVTATDIANMKLPTERSFDLIGFCKASEVPRT